MKNPAYPITLFEARKARELSQERAARLLDCSLRWYVDIESGAKRPGLDLAVAIEREFGIPVEAWASRSQSEAVA